MTAAKRQRYDIAINGQGFVLALKPEQPALKARQNDIFSQRIAQNDRDYNDFISWWYLAQTDWYNGFKDVVMWADDSHFYYSTNIDPISEPGAIKLANAPVLLQDLGSSRVINTGVEGFLGVSLAQIVGTDGNGGKGIIWLNIASTWTDKSSATYGAGVTGINQVLFRNTYLWAMNTVTSSAYGVSYMDSTFTWVDVTANIESTGAAGGAIRQCTCAVSSSSGTMYFFVCNSINNRWSIVTCTKSAPTLNADFTRIVNVDPGPTFPVSAAEYQGKIYYLMTNGELRVYSPSDSKDATVNTFTGVSLAITQQSRLLQVFNNLLHITLPANEVWTYDGTNLDRLYVRDTNKQSLNDAVADLTAGGTVVGSKIYWGNLIAVNIGDTKEATYNWIKNIVDTATVAFRPIFGDSTGNIYGTDSANPGKLYKVTPGGSVYKSTSAANYLVFNNFDKVSGIDKLAYSITFIFKTLVSGQSITWEYATGDLSNSTSWTSLGSASFATDGAINNKTLFFGDNITYKKIWFRVKLDGGGSNTPVLLDGPVFAFLPMPDYKLHWEFTVKCQNKVSRKDQSKETKDGLWLRNFLQQAWLTKSILSFEDFDSMVVDYVADNPLSSSNTTITVKGNTDSFPELGRLLIDSEEIFYSGKTKTTFLNCTRGQRGSLAASHTLNTQISMAHRVIIRNYTENILIANDPLDTEYHVSLALQEV